ncbi:MAG: ABC transporter permease [Candidatus Eremiobacteraeota bacterium]|nr:ABC transporter permease [Candidatus Eremiobacteraeota bacterium]
MLRILTFAVILFLIAPVILLVPIALSSVNYMAFPPPAYSLQWFALFFSDRGWLAALFYSLRLSVLVAVVATLLSLCASLAIVRGALRSRKAISLLVLAPLIVPEIITTIALFFVFAKLHIVGTATAIVIGQSILGIPVATILISSVLVDYDIRLEQAAILHGASPLQAFIRITLPLVAPGIIAALLFTFLGAFDNLLIALFMASPIQQTLPVRIWTQVQFEMQPVIAAVGVFVSVLGAAVLVAGAWLQSRSRPAATT